MNNNSIGKISIDEIVQELEAILFIDLIRILDDQGNLKDLKDMDPRDRRAIKNIHITQHNNQDGSQSTKTKIELWSKQQAAEILLRYRAIRKKNWQQNKLIIKKGASTKKV